MACLDMGRFADISIAASPECNVRVQGYFHFIAHCHHSHITPTRASTPCALVDTLRTYMALLGFVVFLSVILCDLMLFMA